MLDRARTADARIISTDHDIAVPFATDIECLPDGIVVAARGVGQDFRRFRITPPAVEELSPLKTRGYDGLGIVRTPDDRIGFFTEHGFRHAVSARARNSTNASAHSRKTVPQSLSGPPTGSSSKGSATAC